MARSAEPSPLVRSMSVTLVGKGLRSSVARNAELSRQYRNAVLRPRSDVFGYTAVLGRFLCQSRAKVEENFVSYLVISRKKDKSKVFDENIWQRTGKSPGEAGPVEELLQDRERFSGKGAPFERPKRTRMLKQSENPPGRSVGGHETGS